MTTTTAAPPPPAEDIPGVTRRHRPSDLYHENTNFQFIKHTRRWAILSGTLMAARTGESSIRPEWHAEPVDAATPRSCPRMSAPILPTNDTLSVLGRRSES